MNTDPNIESNVDIEEVTTSSESVYELVNKVTKLQTRDVLIFTFYLIWFYIVSFVTRAKELSKKWMEHLTRSY